VSLNNTAEMLEQNNKDSQEQKVKGRVFNDLSEVVVIS